MRRSKLPLFDSQSFDESRRRVATQLVQSARVVVSTAHSACTVLDRLAKDLIRAGCLSEADAREVVDTLRFSVVVFDEAGAMTEVDMLGSLAYGARAAVVVGDPSQLPPFTYLLRPPHALSLMARFSALASCGPDELLACLPLSLVRL